MRKYYQQEIETLPVEKLRALQSEKLVRQVAHVYAHVPYYRAKMDAAGVSPEDIRDMQDLHKLPMLTKDDLRETYPRGMLAVPLSDCVRIQSTSGTTGKRVIAYYTQRDLDLWEDCCARAIVAMGGSREDVCQIAYGYGLFTGGAGMNGGSHKVGCLTVPMSSGNTERQVQFMQDLQATILCCTPSYAAYIGEVMKEQGIAPENNSLRIGIFGAEPWTEEMRRDIERSLGLKAYDIYGLTELSGPGVAFECREQQGMHINEDHFIAEIIDPDTGEVLPEGQEGELVFTSVDKEAFPLLRYRTRDICRLNRDPCPCGRTFIRMRKPMGRSDDMLIIRGVNIYPSQIETTLIQEGYAPNYQILVDRVSNMDTLDINVELTPDQFDDTVRGIAQRERNLEAALRAMLGVSPRVHLVAPKTIARSEGKALRVIDRRKLH